MSTSDIADIKATYPNVKLSDADAKAYIAKRAGWFKGSIAVCCIYGAFALALLLISLFSEAGKATLSGYMMPFTVTLIGGMIVIIVLLVIQITTFVPIATPNNTYDGDICPDYWTFKTLSKADVDSFGATSANKYLMKGVCVPNKQVYDFDRTLSGNPVSNAETNVYNQNISVAPPGSGGRNFHYASGGTIAQATDPAKYTLFNTFASENLGPNGTTAITPGQLSCDWVFPNLLATEDQKNFPSTPNAMRCAYAKACGIPWTGVCPNSN